MAGSGLDKIGTFCSSGAMASTIRVMLTWASSNDVDRTHQLERSRFTMRSCWATFPDRKRRIGALADDRLDLHRASKLPGLLDHQFRAGAQRRRVGRNHADSLKSRSPRPRPSVRRS